MSGQYKAINLSKAELFLKFSRLRSDRLNESITQGRLIHLLHPRYQVKWCHFAVITEEELGSFTALKQFTRPITKRNIGGKRHLLLKLPFACQVSSEHVSPNSREFLTAFGNIDHPVIKSMPVITLVPPEEGVFGPCIAIIRRVPIFLNFGKFIVAVPFLSYVDRIILDT